MIAWLRISDKLRLASSSIIAQVFRVSTTLIMARNVSPADYGAYTLVISIPGVIGALGDFCIPSSIVQMREFDEEAVIDTGAIVSGALHSLYGLITIVAGFYLSSKLKDHRLIPVSILAATTGIANAMYNVRLARLNRRLEFRTESQQNIIFAVAQAVTGIVFALLGFGIFALAIQALSGQVVANVALYRHSPGRVPRAFNWRIARRFWQLGAKVTAANYVDRVQGSVLSLVVNQIGGEAVLGEWGRAVQIQQLFAQNLTQGLSRVVFPLLCRVRDNAEALRTLVANAMVAVVVFCAFAGAWLAAGNVDLVRLMLGPQWKLTPQILYILAFATPVGGMYMIAWVTSYAVGRTSWLLWASVADIVTFIPLLLLGRVWGIHGIAWVWVISQHVTAAVALALAFKDLKVRVASVLSRCAVLTALGVGSGYVMFFLIHALPASLPRPASFSLASLVTLCIYACLVWIVQRSTFDFVRRASFLGKGVDVAGAAAQDKPGMEQPAA